jgi:pyruvate-formate lyase
MMITDTIDTTYTERLDALRAEKLRQTRDKQTVIGFMDHDDKGIMLPPPEMRELVSTISGSGQPIIDCLFKGFTPQSNHPNGGWYGPKISGVNFRALLDRHPVYVDPNSSLAGGYMVSFLSYRSIHWNPDFDYSFLQPDLERYKIQPCIGASNHFCQDLAIGLRLGWGGLLQKIRHYRALNQDAEKADFYAGLEDVVLGSQDWIRRTAEAARQMSEDEKWRERRTNLQEMADINQRLVSDPPQTFREACQWILWFQVIACIYNGTGSLGRLDRLLLPYYERDLAAGQLSDEEAIFHIACVLLRETSYIQLGGPDEATGQDAANRLSYLVLEAAHRLKIPADIGVCVGDSLDPGLLQRGVEVMLSDRTGMPKFLGIERTIEGFTRNGYPLSLARSRAYSGCHWSGIPGREYCLNDCIELNFAAVLDVALREMMADHSSQPSVKRLWAGFTHHLQRGIGVIAQCIDFQIEHMHQVFPELVLDLCCYGPIEKGLDISHGGVEFYNLCLDGVAIATVADSFAALEQRIEIEKRLTWDELIQFLDTNWAGLEGEQARLMLHNVPHFGRGGSLADEYAVKIARTFTDLVKEKKTPAGFNMIPGLFSWANHLRLGKEVGATPNGRLAGAPLSHGANPDPGFRKDGAPTAMAAAVAAVQPGYGNTAPLQIDLDPSTFRDQEGKEDLADLIRTHFRLGGTQINMNVLDAAKILEAHQDPSKYPDLVVRVTGFSAYFASLSAEMRQLVVDRILVEGN